MPVDCRREDTFAAGQRRAPHRVPFLGIKGQGQRRQDIRRQVDPEDLQRQQHCGESQEESENDYEDFAQVAGKEVYHGFPDIFKNSPPFGNSLHDREEAVILQDDIGGFLAHLRALDPHCDPDIRLF